MRYLLSTFLLLIFVACTNSDKPASMPTADTSAASPTGNPSTMQAFADSMATLSKIEPASINQAVAYFSRLVPADSSLADSAAVALLTLVNQVVDTVNGRLMTDTSDYVRLIYASGPPPTAAQKAFQQRLKESHIRLQGDGEGGVVAEPDYGWIRTAVQSKTSSAVDDYMALLQRETINPTLLDAGIAIEMRDLVERAIAAEGLQPKNLPATFAESLADYNRFYTNTVLYGSDNSPALENETTLVLTPDFRQGYDYVLGTYPASNLAKRIREWTAVLNTKDVAKAKAMRESAWR